MNVPYVGLQVVVPHDWIDINGHMNATYYCLVIYEAHVKFTEEIGLGDAYVAATRCGKAVLESHLVYEREISRGEALEVRSWLLAVDKKRLHFFHEIYKSNGTIRAATGEQVDIHIDLVARRSTPLPDELHRRLLDRVAANRAVPIPAGIGRAIRPPYHG